MEHERTEAERTILFADVVDSTGITEALGDQESRKHIASLLDELTEITQRTNGYVIKTIGDEIMCAFPTPIDGLTAAVDMQRALDARPHVKGIPSRIKVGVHSGPVLLENNDVYGDVVNVAARVVSLAAAEQVLTTADTLEDLDAEAMPFRSLGHHQVRGRDEQLHLCEVLWRGEEAALTAVAPKLDPLPTPELEVHLGDQHVRMEASSSEPVTLGRGNDCSVVVPSGAASRSHAKVIRRSGRFYLEDHSTNGTYVQPTDGNEIFVHRDQVLIQGSGRIRLGEPLTVAGPLDIEFKTVYPEPAKKD